MERRTRKRGHKPMTEKEWRAKMRRLIRRNPTLVIAARAIVMRLESRNATN
jgi:hypothetical protein